MSKEIIRSPFKALKPGRYIYNRPGGASASIVTVEDTALGMAVRFTPGLYPTFLKDIHVEGTFQEADPINRRMFEELWVGDRFQRINSNDEPILGEVWTKLSNDTARHHSQESIALGRLGNGYVGDSICSFEDLDAVNFIPV